METTGENAIRGVQAALGEKQLQSPLKAGPGAEGAVLPGDEGNPTVSSSETATDKSRQAIQMPDPSDDIPVESMPIAEAATSPPICTPKRPFPTLQRGVSNGNTMENSVSIVKGEIHNVLSLMRLNRRYSSGARFHREIAATAESPLLRGLKALHDSFAGYSDLQDMDTLVWLRPFLDVIESPETSGPITGVALSSLSKFLLYGFIHPRSPRAAEAVGRVCRVVTRCRFERTDHAGDEVVLVRILQVLLDCLRCPAGVLLTDSDVWGMVRCCFHIGRQQRVSVLLQRTAEHILTQVTLTIFARFSQLQAEGAFDEPTLAVANPSASLGAPSAPGDSDDEGEDGSDEPYGLACMHKCLAFYCQLTNPGGDLTPEGENSKMLGLALVNVILETGGRQLSSCPALVGVLQHDLSRNLLQNSRTSNLQVLSLTLRVVFNMFNSVREHMKVQLEVFFNSIHLAESQAPENREMALESLVEFCREPRLMVDIYTNYDCDVQCTNLFEDMCRFLSKNAFPFSGSLNALNLLSLEGLLSILRSLADACDAAGPGAHEELEEPPTPGGLGDDDDGAGSPAVLGGGGGPDKGADRHSVSHLRWAKQRKKRLLLAAEHFNRQPGPKGLELVQGLGLLEEPLEGAAVAAFLRSSPGLDRVAVGVFLGEPSDLALATLSAFVGSFDFTNMALTEALRTFLDSFRLPGEAQKIARIVEAFAARYFALAPGPLHNADTAYILSYAIIMLNTDLHNPQVKKKMTKDDFIRMNRGINNDGDLPAAYLSELYDDIHGREIKMTEDISEVSGRQGTATDQEPRWDDLLTSMRHKYRAPMHVAAAVGTAHGRDMFLVVWDRVIAALSVVFETTEDDRVLRRALEGLHDFAKVCAFHRLYEEFNKLIATIVKSIFKFAEAADAAAGADIDWAFVRAPKALPTATL